MVTVVLPVLLAPAGPAEARPATAPSGIFFGQPGTAASVDRVSARTGGLRLYVPKLGVDSRVVKTGITSNGELAVGPSVSKVYTWRYGVKPGRRGSAVIAGHTWSRGHGVFDDLGSMRRGDRFRVNRATFRVTKVETVHSMSAAKVRRLFSDRGKPRVVLITCGDRTSDGVYHSRTLVHSAKVKRHR